MIETAAVCREKIRNLAGLRSRNADFLTVTLSTSNRDNWRQFAPTFLNSEYTRLLKERDLAREARQTLRDGLDYALEVLKYEITPKTEGIAIFVNKELGIEQTIELPLPLINRVVIQSSPYVRPVVHALSLLEPFVLARVSRDDSSIYLVTDWGIASEDDIYGPWLRSSDKEAGKMSIREYYAAARQDALVEQHYKEVSSALFRLLDTSAVRKVVLCAQHDIASAFKKVLPQSLLAHITAEISFDANATVPQMVVEARKALEAARAQEVTNLAKTIREALGAGGRGVSGFDQVLSALGRHQVQLLLLERNYRPPGWACVECSWVGLTETPRCPACGGKTLGVIDAAGEAVRLALFQNADVEIGENDPVLAELGNMAGMLRYA